MEILTIVRALSTVALVKAVRADFTTITNN